MKKSSYIAFRSAWIAVLLAAALLAFLFLRQHAVWIWKNLWWILAAAAFVEVIETLFGLFMNRKKGKA